MKPISTTLVHKVRPPAFSGPQKPPALVLLHGRGTNEDDLLGLVDYLDPRFFMISARAPFRFDQGSGGHTWYDVRDIGTPHAAQFDESYDRLVRFVTDVRDQYPIDPQRLFLLGFSMGSVMSFALSLTRPDLVRGIVAHSGYIPEQTSLRFAWDKLGGRSFFVAHGVNDPVVPVSYGRRAHDLLTPTEADLTYREYAIPHTISEQSLADFSEWLQKMLAVPQDMR